MKPLQRIEYFLAKIAGDSSVKKLNPKMRDEVLLKEIAESDSNNGIFDHVEGKYILLKIPKESAVVMTPEVIEDQGSCVMFEGDSGGAVFLNNIRDPIYDNQAATKAYVDSHSGGSNAPLICTNTSGTLDKTMGEICTAFANGTTVQIRLSDANIFNVLSIQSPLRSREDTYEGYICGINYGGLTIRFKVAQSSLDAALAAYPTSVS